MLVCCNRVMVPIYRGIDFQCLSCVTVVESPGGLLVCGRCGHQDCEHIENIELVQVNPRIRVPSGLEFHYRGDRHWYGTIGDRYYELKIASDDAEPMRLTSVSYRARVVQSARVIGAAAASRKSGIPAATIRQWVKRAA
jgi:hypothetical protein